MFQEGPSKKGGQPTARLSAVRANLKSRSGLANICAYRDTSGLFTEEAVSEKLTTAHSFLQGDPSGLSKPIVDIDVKVAF